ncbi:RNA 2',3'-cyclic phosphodiesterase [Nocardioides sp. AE5]|uniref:RNA 2',3'-cyclic phosphodiesterase n=1 Tax=Nocardioides sp. AE5 TaxID=2962573 RepID=UPI002880FC55|nr:RNA 2',3'-cyclic phosphodiesterase [Nocardioides sp. AE5]MDT0202531.1 RNA 2',3'-cyclic phosphodiesterase [Nocardioides sp. AE5]
MRVFAAIIPPVEVVEHLDVFLEPRRAAGLAPFRWSAPEQWHITCAFMAEVEEWRIEDLLARLGEVASRRTPFGLGLAGGGAFPDADRAKVLWGGVTGETEALQSLATSTRSAANAAGAAPDGGRFRAHLTLGRLSRPGQVTNWVRLLDAYAGPTWSAESLTVVASHLGEGPRGRPRHEVLAELPLLGETGA